MNASELKFPCGKTLALMSTIPWPRILILEVRPPLNHVPSMRGLQLNLHWPLEKYFELISAGMIGVVFGSLLIELGWMAHLNGISLRRYLIGTELVMFSIWVTASWVRKNGYTGDSPPRPAWLWRSAHSPLITKSVVTEAYRCTPVEPRDSPRFSGKVEINDGTRARLAGDWVPRGVREVWRRDAGQGWFGLVVAGGVALTHKRRDLAGILRGVSQNDWQTVN